MSPEILFPLQLVLGYVAWLLCFGAYVPPRLMSMDRVDAQRAIATLHSFRFFGLVFMLPGLVGPNLPADFAVFAARWDQRPMAVRSYRAAEAVGGVLVFASRSFHSGGFTPSRCCTKKS